MKKFTKQYFDSLEVIHSNSEDSRVDEYGYPIEKKRDKNTEEIFRVSYSLQKYCPLVNGIPGDWKNFEST